MINSIDFLGLAGLGLVFVGLCKLADKVGASAKPYGDVERCKVFISKYSAPQIAMIQANIQGVHSDAWLADWMDSTDFVCYLETHRETLRIFPEILTEARANARPL